MVNLLVSLAWFVTTLALAGMAWMTTSLDLHLLISLSTMAVLPIPVLVSSRSGSRSVLMAALGLLSMLVQATLEKVWGFPLGSLTPLTLTLLIASANALCPAPYILPSWLTQVGLIGFFGWLNGERHYPGPLNPLLTTVGAALAFLLSSLPGRYQQPPQPEPKTRQAPASIDPNNDPQNIAMLVCLVAPMMLGTLTSLVTGNQGLLAPGWVLAYALSYALYVRGCLLYGWSFGGTLKAPEPRHASRPAPSGISYALPILLLSAGWYGYDQVGVVRAQNEARLAKTFIEVEATQLIVKEYTRSSNIISCDCQFRFLTQSGQPIGYQKNIPGRRPSAHLRVRYNPSNPRDFFVVGQRDISQADSPQETHLWYLVYALNLSAFAILSLPLFTSKNSRSASWD